MGALLAGAMVASGSFATPAASAEAVTETFTYTGAPQTFTVPAGVHAIDVVACGAQGGRPAPFAPFAQFGQGGGGGMALRALAVTPGESLSIHVGGSGASGGWNGGGGSDSPTGRGGGASDVRQGGASLSDRVVVGGGGGGAGSSWYDGVTFPTNGGEGGGLTGGGLSGAGGTQTGPGIATTTSPNSIVNPVRHGRLGMGGTGIAGASGGGGGLYGGAGGDVEGIPNLIVGAGPGGGGSGLGDSFGPPGSCLGDGWVTFTYEVLPEVTPYGAITFEGTGATTVLQVPVFLSAPSTETVTVDWSTVDGNDGPGYAAAGSDFVATTGTVTFDPGDTVEYVPIEIIGDAVDETPLLWGEWGFIYFGEPTNATLDADTFFGHGLFVIVDDDE